MLMSNGDGTFTAAALDVLLILHHVGAGTYHAAFFEEAPPPGPLVAPADVKIVRLRSKMHHTTGSPTLAGARAHLTELAAQIHVPTENVWREPYPWTGEQGITLVVENWLHAGADVRVAAAPHTTAPPAAMPTCARGELAPAPTTMPPRTNRGEPAPGPAPADDSAVRFALLELD